jgi:ABC-type transport system involved in multi-copper enzyme maturation permease subunit
VSLRTVVRVAGAVFRESARDRVLYNLAAFAVLLIAASLLLGQLTAGQELKIVKDLGLAAMSLFGVFIAVFIGIGLVSREVDRRTVHALLAKPVRRSELVLGKYAGLLLTLFVNLAVMAVVFYGVLAVLAWGEPMEARRAWEAPAADPRLLMAMFLIFIELALVTALALFFSTFASPVLAAAFTVALFVAGHLSADLQRMDAAGVSPAAAAVASGLYHVLPDFALFDVKAAVVHGTPVPPSRVTLAVGYAALYAAGLLLGSVLIFSRRDFR